MTDWIKENIDPPGIDKKNRLAIFSTIGKIMGLVRNDAKKAFNAHFPYLADDKKLEEHGKALGIPHLMYDTPEEYRDRVAAASFFLMKAGERGFILNLLEKRFGDRFQVVEKFLQLKAKVAEITDEEKAWAFGLLDYLIDPAVSLEITDWLCFIEEMIVHDDEGASYLIKRRDADSFDGCFFYDGEHCYDGSKDYGGTGGIHDESAIKLKFPMDDFFGSYFFYDGEHFYDGSKDYSGTDVINDELAIGIRKYWYYDGQYSYDGSKSYDSGELIKIE